MLTPLSAFAARARWCLAIMALLVCSGAVSGAPAFREGWLVVMPRANRGAEMAALHASERAEVVQVFSAFGGMQAVRLPPGANVLRAVEKYKASGAVEFAEPDYILHAALAPNELAYQNGVLWHLNNTAFPGADIKAAAGWDGTNSAGTNIVAVLDSGIRYTHQDLLSNMWVNPSPNHRYDDIYGINVTNYPIVTGDPNDDLHHGTRIAGILGAVGNNGIGVSGVAWKVRMMACKFLDGTGSGSVLAAVYCLDYARERGVKVINASFADTVYSDALYTAINNCRSAGIIVVAAVGNSSANADATPYYPACFNLDNIVSVAATTRFDTLAGFSNYGATNVDLAAPGTEIYSTVNWSDTDYSSDTGTSYAAPVVAGALALMRARWPAHSYRQLIDRLLLATDPLPTLAGKCVSGGRLNLDKALNHWPATLTIYRGPIGRESALSTERRASPELHSARVNQLHQLGRHCH